MPIGVMRAPVLNTPRYAWYQKRKHRRIPKRAESKKYIDAAFTKSGGVLTPPAGFARAFLIEKGLSSTVRYGFVGSYSGSGGELPYGGFSPDVVAGQRLVRFAVQEAPATNNIIVRFGDSGTVQLAGVSTINLTIQGFGALSLTWSAGLSRYQGTSASFWTFASNPANVGRIFGVNGLPASADVGEGQLPDWDAFDDEMELQEVIDHFVLEHGVVLPDEWSAMSLAERIQWAKDNIL